MALYVNIRGALQNQLESVSGIPTIFYESMPNTPVKGTPYVQCALVPTQADPQNIGRNPTIYHAGTFEIGLAYPSGKGTNDIETMADLIKASFKVSSNIALNSVSVNIAKSERGLVVDDTDWIRVNVSVSWYVYSTDY